MMLHGLYDRPEYLEGNNLSASWGAVNAGAEVKLWPFAEAEQVLAQEHPHLMDIYKGMPLVGKAGVLRYALLEKYGGIYLDLDVECIEPFGDLAEQPLLLQYIPDNPPLIQDTVFGSASPGHPLWTEILKRPRIHQIAPRDEMHASYLWGALPLLQLVQRKKFKYTDAPLIGKYTLHHSKQTWKGKL